MISYNKKYFRWNVRVSAQCLIPYNWSYGSFCEIFADMAKIWLPWERPFVFGVKNVFFELDDHENTRYT